MARRKIFNPLEAKNKFILQRWILLGIVLAISVGIYSYWQGFPYSENTNGYLQVAYASGVELRNLLERKGIDVPRGTTINEPALKLKAFQSLFLERDVQIFAVLIIGFFVSVWFYRNRVRQFVFSCPKCRKAIWIRDPWMCESCDGVNTRTKKYNIFTQCGICGVKQDAYQCQNPSCNEVLPLIEGADVRTFAKKYRVNSGNSPGDGQAMQVVPPSRTEVLPRDRSFF